MSSARICSLIVPGDSVLMLSKEKSGSAAFVLFLVERRFSELSVGESSRSVDPVNLDVDDGGDC